MLLLLPHEVVNHVDMLAPIGRDGISNQTDSALVIVPDAQRLDGVIHVGHELPQPHRLTRGKRSGDILGLNRRRRRRRLFQLTAPPFNRET